MSIEVPPRRFIEDWQKAEYVSNVAQKLRLSKGACRIRAWRYRNHHGIPLKYVPTTRPGEPVDWGELAGYARKLAPDDTKSDDDDDEGTKAPEAPPTIPACYADISK
jgi:hypothetical protein